jgi:hypothetical protein
MHKIRKFHEGHSTVGEWQGRGRGPAYERHGMGESAFNTVGERHGMCESAYTMPFPRRCHAALCRGLERSLSERHDRRGMCESNTAALFESNTAALCKSNTAALCESNTAALCKSNTAALCESNTAALCKSNGRDTI